MKKGAGDMSIGMPGGFPEAGGPAPDEGKPRLFGRLQSFIFREPSRGEHHKKLSDTGVYGTKEKKKGK
jgi:hypothetical protein